MELNQFGILFLSLVIQANCYIRVCYYTNWSQHRPDGGRFTPADIDPYLCTHIIFAFAKIDGQHLGPFEDNDEPTDWSPGLYEQVTSLKEINRDLKVILAVGGWNAGSRLFANMITNDKSRAEFIQSTIRYLRERNFDGLDIDWEYPARRRGRPRAQSNLRLLLSDMRESFQREAQSSGGDQLLLTAAVPASKQFIQSGYDVAHVTRLLDFINVMTYDFHGSWESRTGHNSPLFKRSSEIGDDAFLNVEAAISYWLSQGATRDKLVVGIPTYGRSFTLMHKNETGMGAPDVEHGPAGHYTKENGFMAYYEICNLVNEGATTHWHQEHKVPYLVNGTTWVGYENQTSIQEKVAWVKEQQLAGTVVWSLDLDDFAGEFCNEGMYPLITTIKTEFTNTAPEARIGSGIGRDVIAADSNTISEVTGAIQLSALTLIDTEGGGLFSNPSDATVLKTMRGLRIATSGAKAISTGQLLSTAGDTVLRNIVSAVPSDNFATGADADINGMDAKAGVGTVTTSGSSIETMPDFNKPSNAHAAHTHGTWEHVNTQSIILAGSAARKATHIKNADTAVAETTNLDAHFDGRSGNAEIQLRGISTMHGGIADANVVHLQTEVSTLNDIKNLNTVDEVPHGQMTDSISDVATATLDKVHLNENTGQINVSFNATGNTADTAEHMSLGELPAAVDSVFLLLPIPQMVGKDTHAIAGTRASMIGNSPSAPNTDATATLKHLNVPLENNVGNVNSNIPIQTVYTSTNLQNVDEIVHVQVSDANMHVADTTTAKLDNNRRHKDVHSTNDGSNTNSDFKFQHKEMQTKIDTRKPGSGTSSVDLANTDIQTAMTSEDLQAKILHTVPNSDSTGDTLLSKNINLFGNMGKDANTVGTPDKQGIVHASVHITQDKLHPISLKAEDNKTPGHFTVRLHDGPQPLLTHHSRDGLFRHNENLRNVASVIRSSGTRLLLSRKENTLSSTNPNSSMPNTDTSMSSNAVHLPTDISSQPIDSEKLNSKYSVILLSMPKLAELETQSVRAHSSDVASKTNGDISHQTSHLLQDNHVGQNYDGNMQTEPMDRPSNIDVIDGVADSYKHVDHVSANVDKQPTAINMSPVYAQGNNVHAVTRIRDMNTNIVNNQSQRNDIATDVLTKIQEVHPNVYKPIHEARDISGKTTDVVDVPLQNTEIATRTLPLGRNVYQPYQDTRHISGKTTGVIDVPSRNMEIATGPLTNNRPTLWQNVYKPVNKARDISRNITGEIDVPLRNMKEIATGPLTNNRPTMGQNVYKPVKKARYISGKTTDVIDVPLLNMVIATGTLANRRTLRQNVYQPLTETETINSLNEQSLNQQMKTDEMWKTDTHQQRGINKVNAKPFGPNPITSTIPETIVEHMRADMIAPRMFETRTKYTVVPIQSGINTNNGFDFSNRQLMKGDIDLGNMDSYSTAASRTGHGIQLEAANLDSNRGTGKSFIERSHFQRYPVKKTGSNIDQSNSFVLTNTLDRSNIERDLLSRKKPAYSGVSSEMHQNRANPSDADKSIQSRYAASFNTRKTSVLDPLHSTLEHGPQGPDPTRYECKIWNVICLDHIFDLFFHASDWHVTGEWHRPRNWLPGRWSRLGAWLRWNRQQQLDVKDKTSDNTI